MLNSNTQTDTSTNEEAAQLREIIALQNAEIARLQSRLDSEQFAGALRNALLQAGATKAVGAPLSHEELLQLLVETAAFVIGATSASLFLLDDETNELVFQVALGQKAEQVKKLRVPLGHGFAGLVAQSGETLAVSNAQSDMRLAFDIGSAIGYTPRCVLCAPLQVGERVIGVLELLDKRGAHGEESVASFSQHDQEALSLFARGAAVAIAQSRTHHHLTGLLLDALALSGVPAAQKRTSALHEAASRFVENAGQDRTFAQTLELADLVHAIAGQSPLAGRACATILRGVLALGRADEGANS